MKPRIGIRLVMLLISLALLMYTVGAPYNHGG
ncbi:hypothetical protein Ga0074812_101177 [Parafrankia irregularis]|uniref:Uncharacterized protein n=1 Tax=Parafrankia irregularis TaxID=795642 RepID=A0A0S4QEU6_9ACTN|nr:hypothetical protein Ga0074812_101177 [Parafrankia irregularis]